MAEPSRPKRLADPLSDAAAGGPPHDAPPVSTASEAEASGLRVAAAVVQVVRGAILKRIPTTEPAREVEASAATWELLSWMRNAPESAVDVLAGLAGDAENLLRARWRRQGRPKDAAAVALNGLIAAAVQKIRDGNPRLSRRRAVGILASRLDGGDARYAALRTALDEHGVACTADALLSRVKQAEKAR